MEAHINVILASHKHEFNRQTERMVVLIQPTVVHRGSTFIGLILPSSLQNSINQLLFPFSLFFVCFPSDSSLHAHQTCPRTHTRHVLNLMSNSQVQQISVEQGNITIFIGMLYQVSKWEVLKNLSNIVRIPINIESRTC